MRRYSLPARRCARGTACIVACACGIQFSGCLNSARDLTADVTKNASQAAIAAEQELARKKLEAAVAAAEGNTSAERALQLASAEAETGAKDNAVVADAEKPKGFSFFNYFRKPAAPPVEDPFLDKPSTETVARSDAAKSQAAPPATGTPVRTASAEQGSRSKVPEWASNPDFAFDREPRSTDVVQRQFPGLDGPFTKFAAEQPAAIADAGTAGSKSKVVGPKPPADWMAEWLASTAPPEAVATAAGPVDENRARVNALIAETRSHLEQGALASAYRSALLAEQCAHEHKLTFAAGETHPKELAREIAARIWEDANPAQNIAGPAAAGAGNESQTAQTGLPQLAQQVFPEDDSFSQWTSLPLESQPRFAAQPSPALSDGGGSLDSAGSAADRSLQAGRLPDVKPTHARGFWEMNPKSALLPRPGESFGSATAEPQLGGVSVDETFRSPDELPLADGGVKFAIAHTITDEQGEKVRDGLRAPLPTAPLPAPSRTLQSNRSLTAAAEDVPAPQLRLPPNSEAPAELGEDLLAYDWEELSRPQSTSKATVRGDAGRNRRWGVLGLIGAIFAGLIGLRLARGQGRREDGEDAEILPVEIEVPEVDNDDRSQLRIKRAA